MQEIEIIQACKRHDRKGQHAFVTIFSPFMFQICKRYMLDDAQAKDALQETLIQVLRKIETFNEEGSFKAWLSRVTANKCLELIRKEKRHRGLDLDMTVEPSIEENVSYQLETEDVLRFMNEMPDHYRIAINMFLVEGYSHQEISEQLGITTSSSRSLVSRGRKLISQAFQADQVKMIYKKNDSINRNPITLKIVQS